MKTAKPRKSKKPSPRRLYAGVQLAKALVGLCLGLAFVAAVGAPDIWEKVALAGLVAPLALAILAATPIPLGFLEAAGLALFAGLIAYMALLTGGVISPLLLWLLLVPAEAALVGEKRALVRAGFLAAAALLTVVILEAYDAVPLSRLNAPLWQTYAASMLAALVQAVLIAAAAQQRQRAADLAVAEGAAMYRFLADNALDLITRHGPDGRIRFASPAAKQILGYEPAALDGMGFSALVHPEDLSHLQSAFMETTHFGRPGIAEVRMRRADQAYVWAEMRCRPADAIKGAAIVAVTRDISQRKAQERALIEARDAAMEASRAKTSFLANMSHELRTPLNAIIGFSEMMEREIFGPVGNARYAEYAKLIHDSGDHLLELINGVLDMSKIEAGKFELYEEMFPLEDVVEQALRFVSIPAQRGGVILKSSIAPGAGMIFADKRAVKQILVNLLSNGVKFTPKGGEVKVSALTDAGGVRLIVKDTGTGIAKADLERLGKPFEQVESAHVRAKEGTGLGLALVKSLAAMHGGEAVMTSAVGVGTTMDVRLPYAAVGKDGARLRPKAEERGARILPFRGAA